MNRLPILTAVLWFALIGAAPPAAAQDIHALLFSECGEEQAISFAERVRQAGTAIEPELIRIIRNGPATERLQRVAAHAEKKFAARKERLANGETLGMGDDLLERIRRDSRQDYVARSVRNYRDGMVKQALTALGILGSARGRQLLRQIRRDENSPYRDHARFVLHTRRE